MLCLSRKKGERIIINDNIVVTVLEIKDGAVQLGIEAPRHIPVWREELHPDVQRTIYGPMPIGE